MYLLVVFSDYFISAILENFSLFVAN